MSAPSGVRVQAACTETFDEIKLRKKHRYIVYNLTDDLQEIQVLKLGEAGATYAEFVAELKESEDKRQCRYGLFDCEYQLNDGQQRRKLVFFTWNPESATVLQKMIYTTSRGHLKSCLQGVGKDFQANDHGDLAWNNVLEFLLSTEVARNS